LEAGVPYNWAGVSEAWSGDGYAGIYVYHHTGGYAEYLKTDFIRPLEQGKQYVVSFYYKLSSYSLYCIDRIGFRLELPGDGDYLREFIKEEPLDPNTGSWEYVIDTITARGGESSLTIGNFSKGNTRSFHLKFRNIAEPMLEGRSYYYIDNVRLDPLEDRMEIPVADTLLTEKTYTFQNILFEFDRAELIDSTREEIASLAAYLMERVNLYIEIQGHTDESGTAAYNQTLSERRAKAVADYLNEMGVGEDRISYRGFGETMPAGGEGAKNRRVEFVLTSKERE
ncbi:MAG: OmpA family protein, partial [Cyclobacteriaceae bacterium]|nr:OmpA family protein [Cyclobacteriaceae bacterium]